MNKRTARFLKLMDDHVNLDGPDSVGEIHLRVGELNDEVAGIKYSVLPSKDGDSVPWCGQMRTSWFGSMDCRMGIRRAQRVAAETQQYFTNSGYTCTVENSKILTL
jgi:hypothetical protein